jgi:hypothetical protein
MVEKHQEVISRELGATNPSPCNFAIIVGGAAVGNVDLERIKYGHETLDSVSISYASFTLKRTLMTEDRVVSLLATARAHFAVPEATTVAQVAGVLQGFGATGLSVARFIDDVADEFVDRSLVVAVFTLADASLLLSRATSEEREIFVDDPAETFDPFEYGSDQVEWTTFSHEMSTLRRAIILLECMREDPDRVGNFRVYGGAQWLRESLWAATGIVPRDPGSPDAQSTLFGEAFIHVGREPFAAAALFS